MDLFCPHCSRRVTVPDSSAGQVTSCPLCTKQFMTPSLAPPSAPPPPPPPAPNPTPTETYGMGPQTAPPPPVQPRTPAPSKPAAPPEPPPPPMPPGDYTRTIGFTLRAEWLAFVAPVCFFLIFFLSFFTWHNILLEPARSVSLWGLAFDSTLGASVSQGHFLAYTILMIFPTFFAVAGATALDRFVPVPQIKPFVKWVYLAAGALLTITFLLLCIDFIESNFVAKINPTAMAEKIAIRLHFLAVLASFLMFWLQLRKSSNKPAPKIEFRW